MSEITCIRSSLTIEELRRIIQVYIYQTVEHGYISKDIQMIGFIQVTFLIVSAISISILSCVYRNDDILVIMVSWIQTLVKSVSFLE